MMDTSTAVGKQLNVHFEFEGITPTSPRKRGRAKVSPVLKLPRQNRSNQDIVGFKEPGSPHKRALQLQDRIASHPILKFWIDVTAASTYDSRDVLKDGQSNNDKEKVVTGEREQVVLIPKVQAPHDNRPGELPRKILIERKKRLFASTTIEQMLAEKAIEAEEFTAHLEGENYPPLALFDDSAYDERPLHTILELCNLTMVDNRGFSAEGFNVGTKQWEKCDVFSYDEIHQLYLVKWCRKEEKGLIPRLYFVLVGEDPFLFAERICAAVTLREYIVRQLKHSFFIDSIPHDEVSSLDPEQIKRMMAASIPSGYSSRSTGLNSKQSAILSSNSFGQQVTRDFKRTMNQIVFFATDSAKLRQGLVDSVKIPKGWGPKDYARGFQKDEALTIFNFKMRLFACNISKSVRLSEFEHAQLLVLNTTASAIKDNWVTSIRQHIRSTLMDVTKGSFCLLERDTEVYKFSKLKRLLQATNYMMQQALRMLVEDSVMAYKDLLMRSSEGPIVVSSPNSVQTVTAQKRLRKSPLFAIDLRIAQGIPPSASSTSGASITANNASLSTAGGGPIAASNVAKPCRYFAYNTDLSGFCQVPVLFMDRAVSSLQSIVKIERQVMDQLFWSYDPLISTTHPSESWFVDARTAVAEVLERSIQPLHEYLQSFEPFLELAQLEVEAYVSGIQEKHAKSLDTLNLKALFELVFFHKAQQQELEQQIPQSIPVGIFLVSCADVRAELSRKHERISHAILDQVIRLVTTATKESLAAFTALSQRLDASPVTIEETSQLREFMVNVLPQEIFKLMPHSDACMNIYEALDNACCKISQADFTVRWKLFAFPKNLLDRAHKRNFELETILDKLSDVHRTDKAEFVEKLKSLHDEVSQLSGLSDLNQLQQIFSHITRLKEDIKKAKEDMNMLVSRDILLGDEASEFSLLSPLSKEFEPYQTLWEIAAQWRESWELWNTNVLTSLDADAVEQEVTGYNKQLLKIMKYFERLPNGNGCLTVARQIAQEVEAFLPMLPIIATLCNKGMRPRHWDALSEALGLDLRLAGTSGNTSETPVSAPASASDSPQLTLSDVQVFNLKDHIEGIAKIGDRCSREYAIESSLENMRSAWDQQAMNILPYRDTGTYILRGFDEYIALIDEHVTLTQAMKFSMYKGPFDNQIQNWSDQLSLVSEVLEVWMVAQKSWMYLQPIFDSPDINKQLPSEGKRFATADKTWRSTLASAKNCSAGPSSLLKFCSNKRLLTNLEEARKLMETVQKGLSDYLETKRAIFSRFYFLSNDELLDILSQTKDPTAVQPHLKKCFEGIKSMTFEKKDLTMTAMNSSEGETVPLLQPLDPRNRSIEVWMSDLCTEMKNSIRAHMARALAAYVGDNRVHWMQLWPAQVVLNGSQVHWTRETEEMMKKQGNLGLKTYYQQLLAQLSDMVLAIRGDIPDLFRMTLGALTVIDVHARDVIKGMSDRGVENVTDFEWVSQMRFYWAPSLSPSQSHGDGQKGAGDGDLFVDMVTSRQPYGYEYLGNSLRLVITPLTDKCYLTIMGALQMILGAAPAGPAGTGKTETTKDLAKALAKQCVVFNCSDGLDYLAMGKFFKGLASSGAWACFDEFNRINVEVLSVIAQQILTLQLAVQQKQKRIVFEKTEITVDPAFAVFITMNPGYAGRSELPDNLSALFRPVAMMVPDYALISEIMLVSFGFLRARECANKMVATFRLCSEQLSSQDHYDYGMRAVKTVINAAGNLKRAQPMMDEEELLMRALRDVNVPKFLSHDIPLFEGIISDLFPGVGRPDIDYTDLSRSIRLCAEKKNLLPVPNFVTKCIQLYETICVRHGLMVVGPANGGKSSTISVLESSLSYLHNEEHIAGVKFRPVQSQYLNPKSITMGQLYGEFDPNTREWKDGILASIIRTFIADTSPDLKWVIFDGPVDAIWIESMNTVLDDNKKLCLTSGEIMSLTNEMTMMFEPEDLAVASPATVSRCGMVYMEPTALGIDPIIESWLALRKQNATQSTLETGSGLQIMIPFSPSWVPRLRSLFDLYIPSGIAFIRRNVCEPLSSQNNALVISLLNLIDCYIKDAYQRVLQSKSAGGGKELVDDTAKAEVLSIIGKHLEGIFLFSWVWSLGATANLAGRRAVDIWLREELLVYQGSHPFPRERTVYDYSFDCVNGAWIPWTENVANSIVELDLKSSDLFVPTADSVRYTELLSKLVAYNKHTLMTGPTGTGKTINIKRYLQGVSEDLVPLLLSFSAQTQAQQTQETIDGKTEKRKKGVFGPALGKRFVLFVDDVNMPSPEKYGAQPPLELLRQWLATSGWYDLGTLELRTLVDIVVVCACGPPGGGRSGMSARFKRHFNLINYTPTEDDSIHVIMSTILNTFFAQGKFESTVSVLCQAATKSTIAVYRTILDQLLPTPSKAHYLYNLRDVMKVVQGLLMMSSRKVSTQETFARMWIHECRRVFSDRLICQDDREWFDKQMAQQIHRNWKDAMLLAPQRSEQAKPDTEACSLEWSSLMPRQRRLICADFLDLQAEPRIYEEIKDYESVVPLLEEYMHEYNAESKQPLNLVLFLDAVEHIARITRIIRQPLGNVLLLGVGGSGRQSLTRLAAFLAGYKVYQIEITKNYSTSDWRSNVKDCLLQAGLQDVPIVFLLSDAQIVMESMLEDINSILNSGDVPQNLYSEEDMSAIHNACKAECARKRLSPTKLNLFSQYLARVQRNVHIVLCMSPLGEVFRRRLRMFPSLVNCSTIDWFDEWPNEALSNVARTTFRREGMVPAMIPAALEESAISFFTDAHQSVASASRTMAQKLGRYSYVTPTSYLEFLATFRSVLTARRSHSESMKQRLAVGLEKIISTTGQVATLQIQLRELEPQLAATQVEVDRVMEQIAQDREAAGNTKKVVEAEEAEAATKAKKTKAIADDAQKDLDEALPALSQAVECLNKLKKSDLDEVKSLGRPPAGVKLTMEAACIMFHVKPVRVNDPDKAGAKLNDYWQAAQKQLLNNPTKLLQDLLEFDKDHIPQKVIDEVDPYVHMPEFTPDEIEKASKACTAICMWVRAMHKYHNVTLAVEPKRKLLGEAQRSLDETMAALTAAQGKLHAVEERLQELEESFSKSKAKKEQLVRDMDDCRNRLDRAQKLIGGLSGERDRWAQTIKVIEQEMEAVVGDSLLASGGIAYLGPFPQEFRQDLARGWQEKLSALKIPHSSGAQHGAASNAKQTTGGRDRQETHNAAVPSSSDALRKILGDPVQIRSWNLAGLPRDPQSIENGIILQRARRWPLMIDPQGQANCFIKNMGRDKTLSYCENGLDVVKLTEKNYLRAIENGVRFGKWVLIENMIATSIDAALEPLLLQQKFKQSGTEMIRIGDATIPYNTSFRLFMTTKLANPHYPPELCVKVSLLNFSTTFSGLEDQLLGVVVVEQMPELEEKKNSLMLNNANMKKELLQIENRILQLLSNSQGNILDDVELIKTLQDSKTTSGEITTKMQEAEVTERAIDIQRESYRPVATRGAVLFFCVAEMSEVDPMYQYSLQWFTTLFVKAINQFSTEGAHTDNKRTARSGRGGSSTLNDFFTYLLYVNVCRSLFEKDKLLLSFLMTVRILQAEDPEQVQHQEWSYLISGKAPSALAQGNSEDQSAAMHTEKPAGAGWLTDRVWHAVCTLSSLPKFTTLKGSVRANISLWEQYYQSLTPHSEDAPLPGVWRSCVNSFQKLCILRAFRPEKMTEGMQTYVAEKLGRRFVVSPPLDLSACFKDSLATTPLIFVLSPGSDPTKEFYTFASSMKVSHVNSLSLGQGQGEVASAMVEEGFANGHWVYLQNCHLFTSWMPELEKLVEKISTSSSSASSSGAADSGGEGGEGSIHPKFRLWLTSMPSSSFPVSVLQSSVKMTNEPPKGLRANLKSSYFKLDDDKLNISTKPHEYKKLLFGLCLFHACVQERRRFGGLGWNIPYEFNDSDLAISRDQLALFLDTYQEDIPFRVLNFLTATINYGGRITDDKDLRTVDVLLKQFLNRFILVDGQRFVTGGDDYYSLAYDPKSPHQSYMQYIESLPINAGPEIFGLHANANIAVAETEAMKLFETIMALEFGKGTGGGGGGETSATSKDMMLENMAISIERRIPSLFDIQGISQQYPVAYFESMNSVLAQECVRYNKLIAVMLETLPELRKALRGLVAMSTYLEEIGTSMARNQIPSAWEVFSYPSLKPLGSWVDDLVARLTFIQNWIDSGPPPVYWISGFYFPQAFLTASLQNYARKNKFAIDTVSFSFVMVERYWEQIKTQPECGVFVRGIFLEGARWDRLICSLNDSIPREMFTELCVVHLLPCKDREAPTKGIYRCPLYKTLSRRGKSYTEAEHVL